MQSFMGKLSLHSTFLYPLLLKSTAKSRDGNLCNSQLLKEGDNTRLDPTPTIVREVGSAHVMAACLYINVHNLFSYPKQTPIILKWCVLRCATKNGHHQKDMSLTEIGLLAHDMLIILDSIVNIIEGDLYDHFMSK